MDSLVDCRNSEEISINISPKLPNHLDKKHVYHA